jgi:transposase InsO family protein
MSWDMGDTFAGMGLEGAMPWSVSSVEDEKLSFIADCRTGEASIAELCRQYGISRQCGYELLRRYEAEGAAGLQARSRAPHTHPNEVPAVVTAALLELRRQHPSWGAKKLRAYLAARRPQVVWPALSTINTLLDRHGLTVRRRLRRRAPPGAVPLSACQASNDVWGVDFKGWFRTLDGVRCDPLSLSDLHSRYVLRLQVMAQTGSAAVWPVFDAAFREFGLPLVVRSDNGAPFASVGVGGLSALSINLVQAGVRPERIAPGKPQQNGRHERLHRTVQQETASPPAANARAQQRRFDRFRSEFNQERPHEALGLVPPASVYQPLARRWSGRLREPEYGAGQEVRRVRQSGDIKWRGELVFLGEALIGQPVGLGEIDGGRWQVFYGPIELGTIDAAGNFARPQRGYTPAAGDSPTSPG